MDTLTGAGRQWNGAACQGAHCPLALWWSPVGNASGPGSASVGSVVLPCWMGHGIPDEDGIILFVYFPSLATVSLELEDPMK